MRRAIRLALAALLSLALGAPAALGAPPLGGLTARGCIARMTSVCPTTAPALNGAQGVATSPDGAEVYVAATAADAIDTFRRNADGSLTYVGCINETSSTSCTATAADLDGPHDLVVSPDGAHVYVTAFGSASTILVLNRSPSGVLSAHLPLSCVSDSASGCTHTSIDHPMGLATSPNGDNLYVAESGISDSVTHLTIAANGDLTFDSSVSDAATAGIEDVAVEPNADNIYLAGTTTNDVQRFGLNADGTINLSSKGCFAAPPGSGNCGATKVANGLGGAHGLGIAPGGDDLYVASPGDDAIVDMSLGAGGGLSDGGCIENAGSSAGCATSAKGLNGVSEVVVSPDGHNVYASSTTPGNDVSAFTRNADGSLTPINCVNAAASSTCSTFAAGLSGAAGLAVDPSGLDLFVTGTSADAVTWLTSNRAPTCSAGSAVSVGGAPVPVSLACTDPNGDPLTRTVDSAPSQGTLGPIDQAAGTVTYTPNAGALGPDTFAFHAGDGGAASAAVVETVTVVPAPPVTPPAPAPAPAPAPSPAPPPAAHAPVMHKLAISPSRFRIGTHVATVARTIHTGATISFTLDIAATVKLTFDREESGRLVGHSCKAPTRSRTHHAHCTRVVEEGTLSVRAKAGSDRLRFEGLLSTHHRLPTGHYKLRGVATAASHSGGPHTVSFTLAARHR